ncbi:MAG: SUMF1/EgtB/PvdO family nonheme iron enzyme, partial [Betaproteobacteria bacterium]
MAWFLRRPLRAHGVGLTAALVCACAHAGPAQNTAPATWTNSLGMVFQQVPAGRFTMGGVEPPDTLARAYPALEARRFTELTDEGPAHTVHIRRAFYLGRHEVTVGQFQRFLEASGYQPESEADGTGGYGYNAQYDPSTTQRGDAFEGRDPRYS